jgi:hypothetical protein
VAAVGLSANGDCAWAKTSTGGNQPPRVAPAAESLEVADIREVLVDEGGRWSVGDVKARSGGSRIEPPFPFALFVRSIMCIYAFQLWRFDYLIILKLIFCPYRLGDDLGSFPGTGNECNRGIVRNSTNSRNLGTAIRGGMGRFARSGAPFQHAKKNKCISHS